MRGLMVRGLLLAGALVVLPVGAAVADSTSVPVTVSTTAVNTSSVRIAVPDGIQPTAITGVLTMPELVDATVSFRVNGRIAASVEASLEQLVRIPITPADVVADGTIALSMVSEGPATGNCRPALGEATLSRLDLVYTGTETTPTSLAEFFPPDAARVDVVVPVGANDTLLEAGLTAVAALAARYPEETPVVLGTAAPASPDGTAGQRVVVLAEGRPGEVTTDITDEGGVPTLTIAGTGPDLTDAARALGSAGLIVAGDDAENLSLTLKPREPATSLSLEELGAGPIALAGYGTTSYVLPVPQDAFSTPVAALDLHLEGSHTAVADTDLARLDVRVNGALVGSTVLGTEAEVDLDVHVPAGRLQSVNELELSLGAVSPTGATCAPPNAPTVEVDIDSADSTVTATAGSGGGEGFQIYPQSFEGALPVAIRPTGARRFDAAIDAAALVAALQRAAGARVAVQLVDPDAFLADDRSGLVVGATAADSDTLEAPLQLSATRLVDTAESTFQSTSQTPYAVLQSVEEADRSVLMLGSWAPGDVAAPAALSRRVTATVTSLGWANLDGDLLIAEEGSEPFTAESRTLTQDVEPDEAPSYVKWFVAVIAAVLLLIAFQIVLSIRRDRAVARGDEIEAEDAADEKDGAGEVGRPGLMDGPDESEPSEPTEVTEPPEVSAEPDVAADPPPADDAPDPRPKKKPRNR